MHSLAPKDLDLSLQHQDKIQDQICRKWGYKTARLQPQTRQFQKHIHRNLQFNPFINPLIVEKQGKISHSAKYVKLQKQMQQTENERSNRIKFLNKKQDIDFISFINQKSKEYNDIVEFKEYSSPETERSQIGWSSRVGTHRMGNSSARLLDPTTDCGEMHIVTQIKQKYGRLSRRRSKHINLKDQLKLNRQITELYKSFIKASSLDRKASDSFRQLSARQPQNRKLSETSSNGVRFKKRQKPSQTASVHRQSQMPSGTEEHSEIRIQQDIPKQAQLDNAFNMPPKFTAHNKQLNEAQRNHKIRLQYYKQSLQSKRNQILNAQKRKQHSLIRKGISKLQNKESEAKYPVYSYEGDGLDQSAEAREKRKIQMSLSKYLMCKRNRLIKADGSHLFITYDNKKQARDLLSGGTRQTRTIPQRSSLRKSNI